MKYLWIIMLAVIDAFWIIASIREFIRAVKVVKRWDCDSLFDWIYCLIFDVENWAQGCLLSHVFILFAYSLALFITSSGVAE